MSGRRLGDRMIVVRVGEPDAATSEPRETTLELRAEAVQIVAP